MTITLSERRCFGGVQGFYEHDSAACAGPMRYGVFLPPQALSGTKVPAVYYLAGLECTEETFPAKGGAQRIAAELGVALVSCDTSPRATRLTGDDASWDFGRGAGFYVDATEAPWRGVYGMESHVVHELPREVEARLPIDGERRGIMGHSMGGHGALTLALRHPGRYTSCSALAPIVAPSQVPWGIKAFGGYLGEDRARWAEHDATELVATRRFAGTLLVDQGTADKFLEVQLRPQLFSAACAAAEQPLSLRLHEGYDHGYYFVASFVDDHLRHHARALWGDRVQR